MRMIRTLAVLCLAACTFASVPATALDDPIEIGFTEAVSVSAEAFQVADIAIPSPIHDRFSQAQAIKLARMSNANTLASTSLRTRTYLSGVSAVGLPVVSDGPSPVDPPVPRSVA